MARVMLLYDHVACLLQAVPLIDIFTGEEITTVMDQAMSIALCSLLNFRLFKLPNQAEMQPVIMLSSAHLYLPRVGTLNVALLTLLTAFSSK